MRASEFINEGAIEDYYEENRQTVIGAIQSKCKPYLQQVRGNLAMHRMWRGTHHHDHGVMIADGLWEYKTRPSRNPVDTPVNIHGIFDKYFLEKFGHRYRSDHVTFAVGDRTSTAEYGQGYICIPIGNFDFLWSPEYPDATKDFFEFKESIGNRPVQEVDVYGFLKRGNYKQNQNLMAAIESGNEIMIHCQNYYLLYEEAAKLQPMDLVF